MTLNAAQSVVTTGTTPSPFTPTTSDTVSANDIIPGGGAVLRVITTSAGCSVTVADPNVTAQGNPGTTSAVVLGTSAVRYVLIPTAAVNPSTQVATVTFSTTTGVTYDLIKF